jgi:iron complex outermembrane receptor protein
LGMGLPIAFDAARRNLQTGNVFAQTDIPLVEDRLKLTAGIKFLDNTYSHGNFLPNFRLLWTPDAKQSVWASATRSIRLPSRFERDGNQLIRDGAEFIRLISNPHCWPKHCGDSRRATGGSSPRIYPSTSPVSSTTIAILPVNQKLHRQRFRYRISAIHTFSVLRFTGNGAHLIVYVSCPAIATCK